MTTPVEFALAKSSSHPSGTGSYNYEGSFMIVIQNLALDKQVSIWVQQGAVWNDIFASYFQTLPENRELWIAPASNSEGEFVAKYVVNSVTYWDNNNWMNYKFPQVFDDFAVLAGNNYKVVLGNASLAGRSLNVISGVQNLAFDKEVGVVFTTDNWATVHTAYCSYNRNMSSGVEVWAVTVPIGAATDVWFAIFYRVAGNEYWDNNFSRNYRTTFSVSPKWGDAP
jgi:hypothetical protein